ILEEDEALPFVQRALETGINFFDTADVYSLGESERILGNLLRKLNVRREDVVVATKVFNPMGDGPNDRGNSRKHILDSIDASLRRLGTDYLDLYFCHRYDPDTPIEEVVRTMSDLIHQGKILYWGTSEWDAAQVSQAIGTARQYGLIPPTVEQPQYNMFHRRRVEDELAPLAREFGLGLVTFSPLFHGILTGKYNEGIPPGSRVSLPDMAYMRNRITPERISRVRLLTALASELGYTTAQLAIGWILRRKDVSSVITGATRLEQFDENIAAAEVPDKLTPDLLDRIDQILGDVER
ncbi:MAG TPA: aldo/keto reductase, partial [Anaerolineaceae bacterium]|nr:aldo/keto reductase [Anaerolineaceae bacterium]